MLNASQFIFDGHQYRIKKAEIVGSIGDPYWCDTYNEGRGKSITWAICFDTETDDDELPPPHVDFDALQINAKNWCNLVGYRERWSAPINPSTDDRYGLTYMYDHQLITSGDIQIMSRDETRFHIVATGQNEEGQQFSINALAEFKGISVRGSERDTDAAIRARLKQYIDDTNLIGTPFTLDYEYDSGIRMGESLYSPKEVEI